jgi:hypothetical protein
MRIELDENASFTGITGFCCLLILGSVIAFGSCHKHSEEQATKRIEAGAKQVTHPSQMTTTWESK